MDKFIVKLSLNKFVEEIEISNCCVSLKLMGKFVESWLPLIWGEMEGASVWIVGQGRGVDGCEHPQG